jgi:serine/threonine-protein kinase
MIGTKLAHYEIQSQLGIGGMGEVYLATDTKLGRSVAIKILPAMFASDADRLARFRREAQVLAALNHPNIAQIYGIEEAGDTRCIVMELVEGETLQERIRRGPIPVAEALKIAKQIIEALETAHEKAVIHRDLKPGNVMLTSDGKVKVLDFGLAKALEGASTQEAANSPTLMSMAATNAGVILGTAGYMSPEQVRGHATDQRSDVFSFGCVLYEMLTGRQTFQGETVTDIVAYVVAREPDYSLLPSNLHKRLKDALVRCLAKNRKDRWHAIADLRVELEAIIADPQGKSITAAAQQPLWRRTIPVAVAVVLTAAITAAMTWNLRPQPDRKQIARYSVSLPTEQDFTRAGRQIIAISHDGNNVVYVANNQLYLKAIGEMEAKPILGSNQDVSAPTFSPDGQWIAFTAVAERKLKKIPLAGGASVTLAEMENPFGINWSADDQIFVGQRAGIVRLRGGGGKPETVVAAKDGETFDSPQLLPDGHLLFTLRPKSAGSNWDESQIVIQDLKSGDRKVVVEAGSDARYLSTGHLVYAVGATVFAVPFDVKKLQVTGGPVPILDGVRRTNAETTAAAFLAASDNGTLAFVPGGTDRQRQALVLVNRDGAKKALPIPASSYDTPRVSPDGKHVSVGIQDSNEFNLWVYDLDSNTSIRRLTFGGKNQAAEWTPDGKRLVFRSDRDGEGLYWQSADGSGTAERLSTAEKGQYHAPLAWTPDKKKVIFYLNRTTNSGEFWALSPDGDRKPTQFVATPANVHRLNFSPDGRWMAYGSNEENRYEVYVQPFPPTGAKYKITKTGGDSPLWTPDGRQLIFESNRRLAFVDVQTQSGFTFSEPKSLPIDVVNTQGRPYDITPDGKQFLVMQRPRDVEPEKVKLQINMVLNWFEELKQRVPVR